MLLLSHLEPSETKISSALMSHPSGLEVVFGDGLPQPGVALFRAIAMEAFGGAHRIDGGFHGFTAGQRQGFRDITDAEADQRCLGIGALKALTRRPISGNR